jgi:hypothetical protein
MTLYQSIDGQGSYSIINKSSDIAILKLHAVTILFGTSIASGLAKADSISVSVRVDRAFEIQRAISDTVKEHVSFAVCISKESFIFPSQLDVSFTCGSGGRCWPSVLGYHVGLHWTGKPLH